MKTFFEFDPLHPHQFNETLQIKSRKIYLSHLPLVNSVSISGFLQADTPSDVNPNSFWCDYRLDDGYRSANGEIIFDPSQNDKFVQISYLAIGTVLRAKDMNEVATSLDSLNLTRDNLNDSISNLNIKIGVESDRSSQNIQSHNENPIAHPAILDSLQSSKSEFDTRLSTFDARIQGFSQSISDKVDSLQTYQLQIQDDLVSSISAAESRINSRIDTRLEILPEIRNEFTGVYNRIDELDSKYSNDKSEIYNRMENLLAVERRTNLTIIENAKSEATSRAISESNRYTDSKIAIQSLEFDSSISQAQNRIANLESQTDSIQESIDSTATQYHEMLSRLNAEQFARIDADNSLGGLIVTMKDESESRDTSLQSNIANLSNTLYQARQATNNQIESIRANVSIAEERMIQTADRYESLTSKIHDMNDSLVSEIYEVVQMQDEMTSYIDSKFAPTRQEFADSISNLDSVLSDSIANLDSVINDDKTYMDSYFSNIEESVSAVWDEFDEVADINSANAVGIAANSSSIVAINSELESFKSSVNSSIANLDSDLATLDSDLDSYKIEVSNDFSSVDTSISALNSFDSSLQSSIGSVDNRATNIQTSLGNTNTSIGTLNTKATNIQTSLGTTNSNVSKVQTSLGNTNTSLNNVTNRVSNLESKHNPFTLGTTSSTVNGAVWYIS